MLFCQRETANIHDRFAVAIIKESQVVGHVRRENLLHLFSISFVRDNKVRGYW